MTCVSGEYMQARREVYAKRSDESNENCNVNREGRKWNFRHSVSKTKEDIPKEKIFACRQALRGIEVQAPVHIGDAIWKM